MSKHKDIGRLVVELHEALRVRSMRYELLAKNIHQINEARFASDITFILGCDIAGWRDWPSRDNMVTSVERLRRANERVDELSAQLRDLGIEPNLLAKVAS